MSAKAIPKDRTHMRPCSVSWRRWFSDLAAGDGPGAHHVRLRPSGGMPDLLEVTTRAPGADGLLKCRPNVAASTATIGARGGDHFPLVHSVPLVTSATGSREKGGWASPEQVSCPQAYPGA